VRSTVDPRAPLSAVAVGGTGTGTGAFVASLATVEGGGSGVSMMIGVDGGDGTATTLLDAAADAGEASTITAASRRAENCQAASAATATNNPPPARTSQDRDAPRRAVPVAAAVKGTGRDAGGSVTGCRLLGPDAAGGSVAGRDAAHDAGCDGGPSRC